MVDYLKVYNTVKDKYLSFVLTTVCRYNNIKLKNELKEYYTNNNKLNTKIYLEYKSTYDTIDKDKLYSLDFNDNMKQFIFERIPRPYEHQYKTWNNLLNSKSTILATGTGSGKTESFIYPIFNYIINNPQPNFVKALIIYPLKALTENQYNRIIEDINLINKQFNYKLTCKRIDGDIDKNERELIYKNPPDIILTNYSMLDRILLEPKHKYLLNKMKLKYIVLDELHVYRGAQGIDISYLIKRLQFNLLNNNINLNNIIYVGTSATLSNKDNFEDTIEFVQKIYNKKFNKDNIITSKQNRELIPIDNIEVNKIKNNSEFKIHAMFSKPINFYRCLECGQLNAIDEIKNNRCKKCGSKLIFELNTCRNCGFEYYSYYTDSFKNINNSSININKSLFKFNIDNKYLNYTTQKNDSIKILFFTDNNIKNDKIEKFKLCKSCNSIYDYDYDKCPKCESKDNLLINIYNKKYDKENEYIDYRLKSGNGNYCVKCNFGKNNNLKYNLINNVEKISDENASHIIFDELYCNLPNKKMLIFTDNVQKSSKFARELDETHIKNDVRKELLIKIKSLTEDTKFNIIYTDIINIFGEKNGFTSGNTEYLIKKEIYEELLAKKTKVGALVNRNWIKTSFKYDKDTSKYKICNYLLNKKQIDDYYSILKNLGDNINNFKKITDIKKYIKKEINITDDEINNLIIELKEDKNTIIEKDNYYFLNHQAIFIKKIVDSTIEIDNYFDNWNYNVPLIKTENDTAKTDKDKRKRIESDFKEKENMVVVATPTLELGIDIGNLDCVGQLHTPRSPANYVQRAGRAGRKNKQSIVVTYLENSSLGGYYFYNPLELISGKITPPLFNINLELSATKSLFSLFLQYLLQDNKFKILINNNWNKLFNWKSKIEEIKNYWKSKFNNEFIKVIGKYNTSIYNLKDNISIDYNLIIEDWIKKLDNCIKVYKSVYLNNDTNVYTIDYFRIFGLLPDFAFGSSGTIVKIKYPFDVIKGFSLKQTCPLNTIDVNKKRYNSKSIIVNNNTLDTKNNITYNYKYRKCEHCKSYIETEKLDRINCPICDKNLSEIINYKLFKPLVIIANENPYFGKSKFVKWKTVIIDLPDNYKNTNLFKCKIGLLFDGMKQDNKKYEICSICGEIYNINNIKSKSHNHSPLNDQIIDKYNTLAKYVNLNKYFKLNNENLNYDKIKKLNITMLNTLLSAAIIMVGCEEGEIGITTLQNPFEYIIYDTVEGGIGFVNIFNKKFKEIIEKSISLCKLTCCVNGCIKCIGSYTRQNDLDFLRKQEILPILEDIKNKL